jgi:hypothetical protein
VFAAGAVRHWRGDDDVSTTSGELVRQPAGDGRGDDCVGVEREVRSVLLGRAEGEHNDRPAHVWPRSVSQALSHPLVRPPGRPGCHRLGPGPSPSRSKKPSGTTRSSALSSSTELLPRPSTAESSPLRSRSRTFSTPACPFAASPHR